MLNRKEDINGFWEVSGNPISKAGVFQYSEAQVVDGGDKNKIVNVYRPEEELSKKECIESFKLMPLINDHEFLGENSGGTAAEEVGVHGTIGEEVYFEDGYLKGKIKIFSETLKKLIEKGKVELSAAYRCLYEKSEGVFNGENYDYIQRNLIANHIALVDDGRCGSDVRVLDKMAFDSNNLEYKQMEKTLDKTAVEHLKELLPYLNKFLEEETQEEEHREKTLDKTAVEHLKELLPYLNKFLEEETQEEEHKKKMDNEEQSSEEIKEIVEAIIPAMDAATVKKEIYRDMQNRDNLYQKISRVTGAFNYKAMDSSDIAKYGVKKLGLDCKSGQEVTAINAYLKGFSSAKSSVATNKAAVAQDSYSNKNSPVAKYLRGE
jgi:uncharacterized protein